MEQLPGILQGQCCRLIPSGQSSCVTCCGDQRLLHVGPRTGQSLEMDNFPSICELAGVSMLTLLWLLVKF